MDKTHPVRLTMKLLPIWQGPCGTRSGRSHEGAYFKEIKNAEPSHVVPGQTGAFGGVFGNGSEIHKTLVEGRGSVCIMGEAGFFLRF